MDVLNNVSTSDIYSSDGQEVYEYSTQPEGIEDEDYYCSNSDCDSYFVPSENVDNLDDIEIHIVELDYPTIINLGASKEISKNKHVAFD